MPEEIQPEQQSKSTREFKDWKLSLTIIIKSKMPDYNKEIIDEQIKPFYDQGLMPTVAFNQLFNK